MTDDEPLDPRRIEDLRALAGPDEPDLPRQLTEHFLQGASAVVKTLSAALAANDFTAVRECAHTLKGSSGNMGATILHGLCVDLEMAAEAGQVEAGALAAIERELTRAGDALRAVFG